MLASSLKFADSITDASKDSSTSAELNNTDGTGKHLRPLGLSQRVWIQRQWNEALEH